MRASILIISILAFTAQLLTAASGFAQGNGQTVISLSVKNTPIQQVFAAIEAKADVVIMYENTGSLKNEKVTFTARNMQVSAIMDALLKGRSLKWDIRENVIRIVKPEPANNFGWLAPSPSANNITPPNAPVTMATITGKVTDADGQPIPGATVVVKGTKTGTSTTPDGTFKIEAKNGDILLVSSIGFAAKEVQVSGTEPLLITLQLSTSALNEVLIVGYGTQKKSDVTGAITTVKSDRIANKPVTNLGEALTGEVPGLTITQSSGQPGTVNAALRVRGVGTWGNSAPMVLVDGVVMNMFDVMPTDVESVTTLKDASAAAIYGSRAANGVILITTKRGKTGKLSINYTGGIGRQFATRQPKMAESWQYAEMRNKVVENLTGTPGNIFSPEKIARMKAGGNIDSLEGSTDWYDELINPATMHMHNISMNGGSEKTSYLASIGYTKQDGVIGSATYDRYNMRLNTRTNFTPWLKMDANMAYINDKALSSSAGNGYYYAARSLPYYPVKYSDGTWSFLSAPHNAVRRGATYDYGQNSNRGDKLSLLIAPEITPAKGLNIKATFAYETKSFFTKNASKIVQYDAFAPANQTANTIVSTNSLSNTQTQDRLLTAFLTATYEKEIGKHAFKIMGAASVEKRNYNALTGSRQNFPSNDFNDIDLSTDISSSYASGSSFYESYISQFGRFNYVYDSKYIFEAVFRNDGSSRFADGHRWGQFPSFSAGWRISNENFFKPLSKHIQELKVRGSWGKLGNSNIANHQFLNLYGNGAPYIYKGVAESGIAESTMGNQAITWETAVHTNLALDLITFRDRLNVTFELYKRTTDNILLTLEAPWLLGISPSIQNAGSIENKGWEFSAGWSDKIGSDFRYRINANLSDVRNRVTDLAGYKSPTDNLNTRIEGQPLDALFGWETLGIATDQKMYDQYKDVMHTYNGNWGIGDIIIKDRDGDGQITAQDKTVIGNIIPRLTYGINLGFDYKSFDFSVMVQGVGKRDAFLGRDIIEPMGIFSAFDQHYDQSFDPQNPNTDAYYPRLLGSAQRYNWNNFSHWLQNASYWRVKNISLGYSFSVPNAKINKVRLSLSGQNVLTFTKYRIFDPENAVNSISYPNVAIYTFGASVDF